MLRLFVGIGFPPELKLRLSLLCSGVPGAKWVDPGNFHLTLRFIGEIGEDVAADIDEALSRLRARRFTLQIAGTGVFGGEKPRSLWAGVERSPELAGLRDKIEQALIRVGLAAGAAQICASRHSGAASRPAARQVARISRGPCPVPRRSPPGRRFQPDRELPDQVRLGL